MPLYTLVEVLVEVHYWKASNANKQNIFCNKFHNFWDVIYFHFGLLLTLFYCLHLQIASSMIVKRKKNGGSKLIVKEYLRASTNLSLPSLHNFKFQIFVIIQNVNYSEELKKKIEFYLVF